VSRDQPLTTIADKEITMTTATVVRLVSPSRQPASRAVMPPSLRSPSLMVMVPLERRPHALTAREREVLALLCEGMPNKLIERRLDISFGTVKCHVRNILSKLGVASRVQAVIEAHRRRLLQPLAHETAPETGMQTPAMRLQRA
jgi:two-component system nitrate/nitrite response regulator NarL